MNKDSVGLNWKNNDGKCSSKVVSLYSSLNFPVNAIVEDCNTQPPLKPAASSAALIDPHWSSLTSCSTFQPMHARPSAIGKEPETEENFCRPGGVTSPHFSWPPARHTGRSQELEWTQSDEEERTDGQMDPQQNGSSTTESQQTQRNTTIMVTTL